MNSAVPPHFTLVDSHVHRYPFFDTQVFLSAAFANFGAEAARRGSRDVTAALLLAETAGEHWFGELSSLARKGGGGRLGPAGCLPTDEEESVLLEGPGGETLFVIAGSQIVTGEGLEVLALCSTTRHAGGGPAAQVLDEVRRASGLPVLAWGAGKWWGPRGRVVRDLIANRRNEALWCCDSGVRPAHLPQPDLFRRAEESGVGILRGSDPLPLPSEERRVGSFGSVLPFALSRRTPAAQLKEYLREQTSPLEPYGGLAGPLHFLLSQLRLRMPHGAGRRRK